MNRGNGRVYRPTNDRGQQSPYWSIVYSQHGKRFYESSRSKRKSDAQRLLRQRIGDVESGRRVGDPRKVVLAKYETAADGSKKLIGGLRQLVERQYALDGNKSLVRVKLAFRHLEAFFGGQARAAEITPGQLDAYA